MTAISVIFTPFVWKEPADVELGSKAMASNAKRVSMARSVINKF